MTTQRDGGPASTAEVTLADGTVVIIPGMSIRQFYKAHALAGLLAKTGMDGYAMYAMNDTANECGRIADAMLAEDAEFAQKESQP